MSENILPSLTLHLGRLPWMDRAKLTEGITVLQEIVFEDTGVLIPLLAIEEDFQIAENVFQLEINGKKYGPYIAIGDREFLLNISLDDLRKREWWGQTWHAREPIEPIRGTLAAIVEGDANARRLWIENGYSTVEPTEYVNFIAVAELREHLSELLDTSLVEYYLEKLDKYVPALVRAVRERFDIQTLQQHLGYEVSAGKSIYDLPTTLENLLVRTLD